MRGHNEERLRLQIEPAEFALTASSLQTISQTLWLFDSSKAELRCTFAY